MTLITTQEGATFLITLNRPDKLNALNQEVMGELDAAVDQFLQDDSLKGAIITGSGPKAFAAGADIKEFLSLDQSQGVDLSQKGQGIFAKIEQSPKPIIAAVNGFALGGGCELAMSCHFRLASDNAMFGQPEVKLGLLAGYGGTQRLTRLIGRGKATELLITGDMIDANEALRLGLVNEVTSFQELLPRCQKILGRSYRQSPLAIAYTLEAIEAGVAGGDGYRKESENFGKAIVSEDGKEGATAFLEKRKPTFKGV